MQFTTQQPLLSKATLQKILIIAFIYSISIIPTKLLLMILPGAEVRFSACIPVIAGLLWGPAGAFGSAIGNFIGDFYSGNNLFVCFWGSVSNFFLAYLPYRLWHGIQKTNQITGFIGNTSSFIKFTIIIFVTSFIFSTMLTSIVYACGATLTIESFFIFFSNNFDFPLLFGIPILFYLQTKNVKFTLPPTSPIYKSQKSYYFILTAAIIFCTLFLYYTLLGLSNPIISSTIFLVITSILLAYICKIPVNYNTNPDTVSSGFMYSLSAQATTNLLYLAILAIIFIFCSVFIINPSFYTSLQNLKTWQNIFIILFLSINFIFIIAAIVMFRIEKYIVNPLTDLSLNVKNFVYNNYQNTNTLKALSSLKKVYADEIDVLQSSFDKMTHDIQLYIKNLSSIIAEKEKFTAQLKIASEIQQSFLVDTTKINSQLKSYKIYAGMFPAKEVGGDLYDCFFIDNEHLAIVIADVADKGIPAALFMMMTKTLLKNNISLNPADVLEKTNNTLSQDNAAMMFVTVWLGILHIPSGKINYANAGHLYPLLKTDGNIAELNKRSGPALGICPNYKYKLYSTCLEQNSQLLLFTDGITDCENTKHEFFGNDRLKKRFKRTNIPDDILFAVSEFSDGAYQNDDTTILWLEHK